MSKQVQREIYKNLETQRARDLWTRLLPDAKQEFVVIAEHRSVACAVEEIEELAWC